MAPTIKELKFSLWRIMKSPLSLVGVAIIIFFIAIAVLAPVLAPPVLRDPYRIWQDSNELPPKPPGTPVNSQRLLGRIAIEAGWTTHIFGTSERQYDIYYGCIWGTRTAFRVGITVVGAALLIGLIIGCVAGYYGGIIDELMMRFTDIIFAFPGLILAMALVLVLPDNYLIDVTLICVSIGSFILALIILKLLRLAGLKVLAISLLTSTAVTVIYVYALGSPALWTMKLQLMQLDKALIALTLVGWPGYTRLIRGEILRIKQEDYIEAAKAVGCSDLRIIFRHILPNSIYPILIAASLDIGSIVLTAAALSFLGIGAPVGYADWGQMISFARNRIDINMTYWWAFIIPGLFIFTFVLGWNLLGDAFRDILDPTLRRR